MQKELQHKQRVASCYKEKKARVFFIVLNFKSKQEDTHPRRLKEQTSSTYSMQVHTETSNHRHSNAMSMKHLPSNNRVQGIKTGWAREICKPVFQIESLQKLLPQVVGKSEKDSKQCGDRKRESGSGNCIVDIRQTHCSNIQLYTQLRNHGQDFKDGKRHTPSFSVIKCPL